MSPTGQLSTFSLYHFLPRSPPCRLSTVSMSRCIRKNRSDTAAPRPVLHGNRFYFYFWRCKSKQVYFALYHLASFGICILRLKINLLSTLLSNNTLHFLLFRLFITWILFNMSKSIGDLEVHLILVLEYFTSTH